MRSAVRAVAAVLFLLSTSCGLLGREFTVKRVVNVHASATDDKCTRAAITFNLADDKTFAELRENIGSVELRDVRVVVTNPKTSTESVATKAGGELRVSATENGEGLVLGTFADVPLTADSSQDIAFNAEAASSLVKAALNPPNTFFISANGCADAVPAYFDFSVELTLYASLKI